MESELDTQPLNQDVQLSPMDMYTKPQDFETKTVVLYNPSDSIDCDLKIIFAFNYTGTRAVHLRSRRDRRRKYVEIVIPPAAYERHTWERGTDGSPGLGTWTRLNLYYDPTEIQVLNAEDMEPCTSATAIRMIRHRKEIGLWMDGWIEDRRIIQINKWFKIMSQTAPKDSKAPEVQPAPPRLISDHCWPDTDTYLADMLKAFRLESEARYSQVNDIFTGTAQVSWKLPDPARKGEITCEVKYIGKRAFRGYFRIDQRQKFRLLFPDRAPISKAMEVNLAFDPLQLFIFQETNDIYLTLSEHLPHKVKLLEDLIREGKLADDLEYQ
ncbi:hypothetical protein ABW19_dt0201298 [Dactylella cylindrospora]|nr:hypothetical protein ABW19_dt0201298 [Dactylella cylindrospora]